MLSKKKRVATTASVDIPAYVSPVYEAFSTAGCLTLCSYSRWSTVSGCGLRDCSRLFGMSAEVEGQLRGHSAAAECPCRDSNIDAGTAASCLVRPA